MIQISIHTENAAFEPDPLPEVRRLLGLLARGLVGPGDDLVIRDINGNPTGRVMWHPVPETDERSHA